MSGMKDTDTKFNTMSAQQAKQSKDAEWHSQEFWDVSNWLWEGLDPDDELLIAYRRRPAPDMISMCALCYRWFKSREDFQLHMMTHIGTARFHECSVCHKKFLARFLKKRHEALHRYDSNFPFTAYWGGQNCEFPQDRIVYNHPMKRFKPAPYAPQYIKQLKKLERQCKKQPKTCIACEKSFQSVEELEVHYDAIHATQKCVHCLEILENFGLYLDHLRSVHNVEIPTNSRGGRWRVLESMSKQQLQLQTIKPIILQPKQDINQNAPQIIHYVPLRLLQTQTREKPIQPKPPEVQKETVLITSMPPPPPPARKEPVNTESLIAATSNDTSAAELNKNISADSVEDVFSSQEFKGEENVHLEGKSYEENVNEAQKTEGQEEEQTEESMDVEEGGLPESEETEELQLDSGEHSEVDAEIIEEDVEEDEEDLAAEQYDTNEYVVEQEMLEEETIPFVCHICGRTFSSQENVERHIRLHSQPGDRPFECKHCNKAFASHSNRKEHERIHTGERPYKCMYCERRFIQISNLKKHLQTHKERSSFRCATCDKEFIKESSLVLHQRSHDTERKYRCKVCDRAYNYASLLKRHMRVHTGECPYRCPECKQPFHELVSLHYHRKKMHTGERPHKCSICDRGFILSSDLKKHMRVHFKDQDGSAAAGASQANTNGASRSSSNSSVATEIIPVSEWTTAGNEITISTSNPSMQHNMDEDEILKHLNPQITLVVQSENRNGDGQDDDDDDDNRSVHYEIQNFDESFDVGSEDCVTYEAIELDTDGNGELRIVNAEDLENTTVQPFDGPISFVDENLQVTDVLL